MIITRAELNKKFSVPPREVPLWAFRQILIQDGLLEQIETYTAGLETSTSQILTNFLEYGNFVSRNSTALKTIGAALGKSEEEIDSLFIRASKLRL